MTLLEHPTDGERTRRMFEEANARYEASKQIHALGRFDNKLFMNCRLMSAFGGKADIAPASQNVRL